MPQAVELTWSLGLTPDEDVAPACWMPARVPGAVQADVAAHRHLPPLHHRDTVTRLADCEDLWAIYRAVLPEGLDRMTPVLTGKGIDYAYRIRLNDMVLYSGEGMFTPFSVPLDRGWLDADNVLYIDILPPPKKAGMTGRSQAADSCKPAVCYGWDFHPRLVVRGIWEDITLTVGEAPTLTLERLCATLSPDRQSGTLEAVVETDCPAGGDARWRWRIEDPDGRPVADQWVPVTGGSQTLRAAVPQPELWWPNEWGRPALYTVTVDLYRHGERLDSRTVRRGFRHIRLTSLREAGIETTQQPQTRELPPLTWEINGQPIFIKGTNWVCPTLFPGELDGEQYRRHLTLIRDAHMNMIRCWGGAVVNKESFFNLCDEMGLLVWQEFPLACNDYTDDPHYLEVLDRESAAILRAVRDHACLALWCGGNELFNRWSGMDDQRLALRLLNKNCLLLDPHTPFFPTSPLMGMGHGSYVFCNSAGVDVWQLMRHTPYRAYPEFGCPGAAAEEAIREMIPEEEWECIAPGGSWELHHAIGAWSADAWMMVPTLRRYFPEAVTTSQLIACSRLLQGVGYQALFETVRQQAPYTAMALNWCFNEPWVTAANNSLVSADGTCKPAYAYVCRALRADMVSLRFERFDHRPEEPLTVTVFLLMDRPRPATGRIRLAVEQNGEEKETLTVPVDAAGTVVSCPVAEVTLPLSRLSPGLFRVTAVPDVHCEKEIGASAYDLLLRGDD